MHSNDGSKANQFSHANETLFKMSFFYDVTLFQSENNNTCDSLLTLFGTQLIRQIRGYILYIYIYIYIYITYLSWM